MKLGAIIKKELHRFFHDPRLILTLLLPGIVIFAIYSFMGEAIQSSQAQTYDFNLFVSGESGFVGLLKSSVEGAGSRLEITYAEPSDAENAAREGKADLALLFSEGFDTEQGANVRIFYNAADDKSASLYQIASAALSAYGMRFTVSAQSVVEDQAIGKMVMAQLLPFLVIVLILSACMSVTLESVAGEKERGTLGTILATSVPRYEIALGKILSLSAIAAIGAASSFLGVVLSLPKLMGVGMTALGIGAWSYLLLFLLIVSIVPLIVSLLAAVSTLSKSVKEASAYTSVIMILIMIVSVAAAFITGLGEWVVAVPIFNCVTVMGTIVGGGNAVWQSLVSIGVNLAVTALLAFAVSKMLSSEKIMFGK